MRAVFDGFLTVLTPPIAIVEVIHFTLCHERKSWLSWLLLVLLLWLQPKHEDSAKTNSQHLSFLSFSQVCLYDTNKHKKSKAEDEIGKK